MWNKPFGYSECFCIGGGLLLTGLALQIAIGPINWELLAFPVNVIILSLFFALLVAMHAIRKRVYLFRCLSEPRMAVVSMAFVLALTLAMGLIRQNEVEGKGFSLSLGNMLHAWWFVLPYIWLTVCLGLTALRRSWPFRWRNIPFLLNHWGLFVVLTCATLGSVDVQNLTMETFPGKAEWRAVDERGFIRELPLAVELQRFSMEEYPAHFMVISNSTGKAQPEAKPLMMTVGDGTMRILEWTFTVNKYMEYAAPVAMRDSTRYVGWGSSGATEAALVTAHNVRTNKILRGWVSCGSYLFPFNVLKLDSKYSFVMAEREPKRFSSSVKVYTQAENIYTGTIEVNHPFSVMGWKIYQLDYDKDMGRWSEMSVFRLVRDPWIPAIYGGIFMMLAGAVGLFLHRNENK